MNRRLDMPDGVRVIAIGLVMWFHIWQQSWLMPVCGVFGMQIDLTPLARTGYIMVDIMLMLSGYLLFLPLARGGGLNIKEFYTKRLIRILPSYCLSVFAVLFIFALPGGEYADTGAMWKDIITHLTFTQTFFHDTYISTHLNVVLWTLAIEMQFYLLFPVIGRAFKKSPVAVYIIMTATAMVFRKFVSGRSDIDMYLNQLPAMLDVYANGMLAAMITAGLEKNQDTKITKIFFTALLAFAFIGIWRVIQNQYTNLFPMEARKQSQLDGRFELSALGALALVSGERSFLYIRRIFGNPATRFLSAVSYNAYIWHQFLSVKLKAWKIPNYISESPNAAAEQPWQTLYTVLCFALSIILAALITYAFERPVTKKLTKICGGRP